MATLAEIREQYPQYSDLSDAALADALYGKFYSDIPRKEFDAKLGLKTGPSRPPIGGIAGALGMGVEAPISSVRTGIESLFGGNEAVEAGLGRKAKLGEKYAEQPGFEQVKKAYEERGIFPAIGEYISQVPAALAEQTPPDGSNHRGSACGRRIWRSTRSNYWCRRPVFYPDVRRFLRTPSRRTKSPWRTS